MNVLGVDLSTKAVTAVMLDHEENLVSWHHVELPGKDALERARNASEPLRAIPWSDPSIIAFERPAGRSVRAVMDMWRVMGVIVGMTPHTTYWEDRVIPEATSIWEFTPTDWKKKVGLPGNAGKEQVAMFVWDDNLRDAEALAVVEKYKTSPPQDFYDAYCICLAAVRENAKGVMQTSEETGQTHDT